MRYGFAPNTKRVNNKDFRNFYKRKTAHKVKERIHEYINDRIIKLFWEKVSEYMIERRAGVYVDKVGYFFIYRHPFKKVKRFDKAEHRPAFLPADNTVLKFWTMDEAFMVPIENKLKQKIKKGYRYLNLMVGLINEKTFDKLQWYSRK